jgi:hypothetical protein
MEAQDVKHAVDYFSVGVLVSTMVNWLPHIAALFTIVWTGMRIYERATGRPFYQCWLMRKLTGRP